MLKQHHSHSSGRFDRAIQQLKDVQYVTKLEEENTEKPNLTEFNHHWRLSAYETTY